MTRTSTGTATTGLRNVGGAGGCWGGLPWEDAVTTAAATSASAAGTVRVNTGSLPRKLAGYYEPSDRDRAMKERKPFGFWTLLIGIGWVVGTVLVAILIWRLWTNMPF